MSKSNVYEIVTAQVIAELGAAFVTARLGFEYSPQAASYIASWLEVLKAD